MSIDYIEPERISKEARLLLKNKTKKLAEKFKDNLEDIALIEFSIRQEQVIAISAYKKLVAERKQTMHSHKDEPELFHLGRGSLKNKSTN
jgi:hypothetical protein